MESFTFYFEHEIDSVKIRLNSIPQLLFLLLLVAVYVSCEPGLKRWIVTSVVEKKGEKKSKRPSSRNRSFLYVLVVLLHQRSWEIS